MSKLPDKQTLYRAYSAGMDCAIEMARQALERGESFEEFVIVLEQAKLMADARIEWEIAHEEGTD